MNPLRLFRILWRSLTLFRVMGVPVQFHTTWLVFPCGFFAWAGFLGWGFPGAVFCLGMQLLFLGCVLLHEFAHVVVAARYRCRTERVLVTPVGCLAQLEEMPPEPGEFWVAAAGPAMSLALSGLASGAASMIGSHYHLPLWYVKKTLELLSFGNLVLAGFNLLPCFPMDGGRMLRSGLAVFIGVVSPRRASIATFLATRIAVRWVARPLCLGILVVTVLYTHLWHHILIFGLVMLGGEVEYWLLRESGPSMAMPQKLGLLPVTGAPVVRRKQFRPAVGSARGAVALPFRLVAQRA
jgi:Zn-dependent protease